MAEMKAKAATAVLLGPADDPAAKLLVEFVKRLEADHGVAWDATVEDHEAALQLLTTEGWTWEWAWLAVIGFVEVAADQARLTDLLPQATLFASRGRAKLAEFDSALRLACLTDPLGPNMSPNLHLLQLTDAYDRYGRKLDHGERRKVESWFPAEWKSILWLPVRLMTHRPMPTYRPAVLQPSQAGATEALESSASTTRNPIGAVRTDPVAGRSRGAGELAQYFTERVGRTVPDSSARRYRDLLVGKSIIERQANGGISMADIRKLDRMPPEFWLMVLPKRGRPSDGDEGDESDDDQGQDDGARQLPPLITPRRR